METKVETKAKLTVEMTNSRTALNVVDVSGRTVATLDPKEALAFAETFREQAEALILAIKVREEIEAARARVTQEILDKHGLRGLP